MALHQSAWSGRFRQGLAFDRASLRSYDLDGRLRVSMTNISKAVINPYNAEEVADYQSLGLTPGRVYWLLRDPDELARAAPSFNQLPLLSEHAAVGAENHQPELVVGASGTDAQFDAPYLKASLVVWSQDAIDQIESGRKREVSSAYRYRADMTPGTYEGRRYDGIMRDIVGSHIALVSEGRAGPDVAIGDAIRRKQNWPARERSSYLIIRGTS